MFSCLDYLLAPTGEIQRVDDIDYLARGISDHSPLLMRVGGGRRLPQWRLNAWELRDETVAEELRVNSQLYFTENEVSVPSAVTLWEAYKAVLRDRAQNILAHKRKRATNQLEELERTLLD